MWKDYLYFTKEQKQGIIVLIVLIMITLIGGELYDLFSKKPEIHYDENFEKEYAEFINSLKKKENTNELPAQQALKKKEVKLKIFDPNTVDSISLCQMGIPSWMASNILKYREKGGMFQKPEDFRKIYGLTEELYLDLLPYIEISNKPKKIIEKKTLNDTNRLYIPNKFDSTQIFKFPEGTIVNLNQADTTELKKIPGIGSGIARIIVNYRSRLGGFYNVHQLKEVNLDSEKLSTWFSVDAKDIRPLNLNKISIERLRAHPYFNFYQAKAITEYKNKNGKIRSLDEFLLLEEFSKKDFERMKPYIIYD